MNRPTALSVILFFTSSIFRSQEIKVVFEVSGTPKHSESKLGIRGNTPSLSWDKTLFLKDNSISVSFSEESENVEYKYVLDGGNGDITWEGIPNRQLQLLSKKSEIRDVWNKETPVEISSLKAIGSEDLLEDYLILEKMVLDVHPGTYRYSGDDRIKAELQELKRKFQKPMSIGEAYLAMSKVTASIQCDHTKVGFNNQNKYVNTVIHEQPNKLPFTFKWFDERMIVGLNASDNKLLERGSEILKINAVPVSKIKTELLPYVAADGATNKNRVAKLEVDGFDFRYNAFDVFFPLRFPLQKNEFFLEVKKGNQIDTITVAGIHREKRAKLLAEKYSDFPYSRDDTWRFEIKNDIGVLTLNSFGLSGWKAMTIDYKAFLEVAFDNLKKQSIQKLIIDIRRNAGGLDEMKNELFSYLPFDRDTVELFPRKGRTRFLKFPEMLKPHIKTWGDNPWYYNLEEDTTKGMYYVFEEKTENRMPLPAKEVVFEGEVVLLTSPMNTSLAFYTARDFRQFKIGKIVGEETGGNQNEINGGQILFLTLPNSGIEIDFPVMGAFAENAMPNAGVIPDYIVETTVEHFTSNVDPQMKKAIKLLHH